MSRRHAGMLEVVVDEELRLLRRVSNIDLHVRLPPSSHLTAQHALALSRRRVSVAILVVAAARVVVILIVVLSSLSPASLSSAPVPGSSRNAWYKTSPAHTPRSTL